MVFAESGFWWKWFLMKVVFDQSGSDESGFDESGFWWKWFLMKIFLMKLTTYILILMNPYLTVHWFWETLRSMIFLHQLWGCPWKSSDERYDSGKNACPGGPVWWGRRGFTTTRELQTCKEGQELGSELQRCNTKKWRKRCQRAAYSTSASFLREKIPGGIKRGRSENCAVVFCRIL